MHRNSIFILFAAATTALAIAGNARAAAPGPCSTTAADTAQIDLDMFLDQGGPGRGPDGPISIYYAPILPIDCSVLPCPRTSGGFTDPFGFFISRDDVWHLADNEWGLVVGSGTENGKLFPSDPNWPYAKILLSAYLVYFGLADDPDHSWHGTQDYVSLTIAPDNAYHSSFFRSVSGSHDFTAQYASSFIGDDEITTSCQAFDHSDPGANNVIVRTVAAVHEAWHAWENTHGADGGRAHINNPDCHTGGKLGDCTQCNCERFYPHLLETFRPFGTLHEADFSIGEPWLPPIYTPLEPGNKFHEPTQVAVEFLCDLADPRTSASWVTLEIRTLAQTEAAVHLDNYFINSPAFRCGSNHPLPL